MCIRDSNDTILQDRSERSDPVTLLTNFSHLTRNHPHSSITLFFRSRAIKPTFHFQEARPWNHCQLAFFGGQRWVCLGGGVSKKTAPVLFGVEVWFWLWDLRVCVAGLDLWGLDTGGAGCGGVACVIRCVCTFCFIFLLFMCLPRPLFHKICVSCTILFYAPRCSVAPASIRIRYIEKWDNVSATM